MAADEEPAISLPRLLRVDGPKRTAHPLAEGTTRIGRSLGADIVLEDTRVSRFQCYLVRKGDDVRVFEGESRNPSRVNGEPANGQRLRNGHQLQVGKVCFVFEGPLQADLLPEPAPGSAPTLQQTAETLPDPDPDPDPHRESAPEAEEELPVARLVGGRPGSIAASRPGVRAASRREPPPPHGPRRQRSPGLRLGPFGLGVIAIAAAAALGFFAFGLPSLIKDLRGPGAGPDGAASSGVEARRVAELERGLVQLEQRLLDARREGGEERPDAILEKIQAIEAELRLARERALEERIQERGGAGDGAAPTAAPGAGPIDLRLHLPGRPVRDGSVEDGPGRDASGGGEPTVTVVRPPPITPLEADAIASTVAALCRRIDDYATLSVAPESLEPELGRLAATPGSPASRGILEAYRHADRLVRQVDASIEENTRKADALLAQARAMSEKPGTERLPPAGSGDYPERSQGLERLQRTLEAHRKAVEIHGVHREHLAPLRRAVVAALAGRRDEGALALLGELFRRDLDADLALLAAAAFRDAGFRPAVPVLAARLRKGGDPALREAILAALRAICGEDLGDSPAAWERWWKVSGNHNGR